LMFVKVTAARGIRCRARSGPLPGTAKSLAACGGGAVGERVTALNRRAGR
jgi:hypothetical protein